MPVDTDPFAHLGVSGEELTGLAGSALVARVVKHLGLAEALARLVRADPAACGVAWLRASARLNAGVAIR